MFKKRVVLLLGVFFMISSVAEINAQEDKYVIHCGQWFNSENASIEPEAYIYIDGNQISDVRPTFSSETDRKLIDLSDYLLSPGWIDMHVHLETEYDKNTYIRRFRVEQGYKALKAFANGMKLLKAGFTTVRDLGGSGANNALRNAVNNGLIQGPRIISCRKAIAITGGHADPSNGMSLKYQVETDYKNGVCDGAEECAKAVRWQVKQGADCIKITATGGVLSVAKDGDGPAFAEEELEAIIQTAKDRGVHTAAHAHGKMGMLRAVNAGITTIEHGTYMDEEVMEAMLQKGTYYVPTITAGWAVAENAKKEDFYPDVVRPKALKIGPQIQETFKKAYEFGVPIAFGTDSGVFDHGMNAKEFELMAQAGMPILEALQSATFTNAKVLGMTDEIGQIAPGFLADLVALPISAIDDPKQLHEVKFVMKDGEIISLEK